ncbi:hypothetical protein CUC15_06555 [Oceanobacillus zhaokaii]|uniref:Uncharacterized protein n=1 Tax=Oceanobacillus zhaokaii TaxID=2052660 RepID=A0A345PF17_9BACI|nr:hypothetical protein CUC15_06555 [Oceanobacillus zhaokaii]
MALSNTGIEIYFFSHNPVEKIHEDSCGRKGIGEPSSATAQEGSPASRGKRSVFSERLAQEHLIS